MRLPSNPLNMHPEERQWERRRLNLEICQSDGWRIAYRWHPDASGSFDLVHAHRLQAKMQAGGVEARLILAEVI